MKIVLVSGTLPPGFCGIGDYTARLARALGAAGAEVFTASVRGSSDHTLRNLLRFRDWLRKIQPDILHLQYPGAAFRRSLLPLSLAANLPGYVLTLHEYGLSHPLRKGLMRFLVRRSRAVIFPSQDVKEAVPGELYSRKAYEMIPVGPAFEPESVPDLQPLTRIPLLYFGFINRSRSFEDWGILLSLLSKQDPDTDVFFITGTAERSMDVVVVRERLKERAPAIRVQWLHQARADAISAFLTQHPAIAYLPFVDGLSERRTSLITLLRHGVPCIVTPPRVPPACLSAGPGLAFAESPEVALRHFESLQDPPAYRSARAHALALSASFSWPTIAQRHLRFYETVLRLSP
jgi:glycosyltransferase involved in cell wall biosynthesis